MNENHKRTQRQDLVCYSHLRWGFVFQRPQHLMSRFAKTRRVFFIEEPIHEGSAIPEMRCRICERTGVRVMTPILPPRNEKEPAAATNQLLSQLVRKLFRDLRIQEHIAWYYTPMALAFTQSLKPSVILYDCMDELSLFKDAPAELRENEQKLFEVCDLVFTGGVGLFESKRRRHAHVYPFPSCVEYGHFAQARELGDVAEDQRNLRRPRLGYAGVIDERIDLDLIAGIAERRPEWEIVMVGPVARIDPATLPRRPDIHWLGMKDYADLPMYMAGWDVALIPFAMTDATRYLSPTKTPEYLAAGLPVISTPVRDVERQYGDLGLARIERDAEGICAAAELAMTYGMSLKWRERADAYLATLSWDRTWREMDALISMAEQRKRPQPVRMAAMESSVIPL